MRHHPFRGARLAQALAHEGEAVPLRASAADRPDRAAARARPPAARRRRCSCSSSGTTARSATRFTRLIHCTVRTRCAIAAGERVHLVRDHHGRVGERGLERRRAGLDERRVGRGEDRRGVAAHDHRVGRAPDTRRLPVPATRTRSQRRLRDASRSGGVAEGRPEPPRPPARGCRERRQHPRSSARMPSARARRRARRARRPVHQRMADVVAPERRAWPKNRLLEREDHREPVDRGREPPGAPRPPGPELRRDVVERPWRPAVPRGLGHPEVEAGIVDRG